MGQNDVPEMMMETIIEAQRRIAGLFPECVLVGGSAAALHRGHRYSMDADSVLIDLKERYQTVLEQLENLAGWRTNRLKPPVMILGNFEGVDIGIRQLIRKQPLETVEKHGIRIPTEAEMCRIKAWLIVSRNATRDYLDFVALCDGFDEQGLVEAMAPFDTFYPQPPDSETTRFQLVRMLASPKPYDIKQTDVSRYKGIMVPWNSWEYILERCGRISDILFDTAEGGA